LGYTYDETKNKFILPKPFDSWSLDSNDDWIAPVTYPSKDEIESNPVLILWDEDNQKWLGKTYTGENLQTETDYEWDASGLSWSEV
jgi:hypothetical protein